MVLAMCSVKTGTDTGKKVADVTINPIIDKIFDTFDIGGVKAAQKELDETRAKSQARFGSHDELKQALKDGVKEGMQGTHVKMEHKGPYTNPSAVKGRGGTH